MDQRLILTVPFVGHLLSGMMFVLGYAMADVQFTEGQPAFIALVTFFTPIVAFFLIWLKNYQYGSPLLVGSTLVSGWFITYFFLIHDNPANLLEVSGDGLLVYLAGVTSMLITCLVLAGIGTWIWYSKSEFFRSAVDRVIRPPDAR